MALAIPAFAQVNGQGDGNKSGGYGQSNASLQGQIKGAWTGQIGGSGGTNHGPGMSGANRGGAMKLGVFGTVTAINGNIITINGRQGFGPTATATTTYTVDATNAVIKKNNATTTVGNIAVGDMVVVQGTVSGTNVTATAIFDGIIGRMGGKGGPGMNGWASSTTPFAGDKSSHATTTPPFVGNGQPIIVGTVSVVNGNTLTVTTASSVTYTVDASSAKILKGSNTITLSGIVVGNKVLVQGAVNGTSITASTVLDQSGPANGIPPNMDKGQKYGFFGGLGQFFMHLFGF
jgi:hypothetical protein